MSISTSPPPQPPVKKKSGMGCLGCGCLVLVLLVILFVGLVAGILYTGYKATLSVTSLTPPAIPTSSVGDDVYQGALRKLADFDHDVRNHQAATVQFSADEINAVLAHDPDMINNQVHVFVSLTDNEGRVQASAPTDGLTHGWIAGRYFSIDTSFEVHLDQLTRSVDVIPHSIQLGDKILAGPGAENVQSGQTLLRSFTPTFNQSFNAEVRKYPDGAALLDQAQSIEIKDGQLVVQTH
jgi:hypothetical protein